MQILSTLLQRFKDVNYDWSHIIDMKRRPQELHICEDHIGWYAVTVHGSVLYIYDVAPGSLYPIKCMYLKSIRHNVDIRDIQEVVPQDISKASIINVDNISCGTRTSNGQVFANNRRISDDDILYIVAPELEKSLFDIHIAQANSQHQLVDERILCSAIQVKGSIDERLDDIYLGLRHAHCFAEMSKRRDLLELVDDKYRVSLLRSAEQGFFTSKGRFVDRKEAMTIAVAAKQPLRDIGVRRDELFSEHLY